MTRSMAESSGGIRYRPLESIAAFCLDRLAGDDPVFQRRDRYYTEPAEQVRPHLHGPAQRQGLDRLDGETPNLRAALEHATDSALALRLVDAWRGTGICVAGTARPAPVSQRPWRCPARSPPGRRYGRPGSPC
ncbi:hypothetical protein HD597_005300 [Nonomuraea thailandensis]|uniref:Uncharacterized protein n=1 Tax=Nonomuraea thailandensis TaxID=1188745 RepID=A0A9X2GIE5_9ACTN|nr:hypothetical protein [Nonomuraea thailandensis]MCP2358280.1 hypothetical protein [Nonomuraea thailandensis]